MVFMLCREVCRVLRTEVMMLFMCLTRASSDCRASSRVALFDEDGWGVGVCGVFEEEDGACVEGVVACRA